MQVYRNRHLLRAAALAAALLVAPTVAAGQEPTPPTGVAVGAVEVSGNSRIPTDQILATVE
ncbi:MAG TPA: hypothetical protein VHG09_09595, partial [Longimicrobiales bacterium]|nr:hypothetical protein [Longimicrobiales bacterium]